jgi:cell division protein FtsZ
MTLFEVDEAANEVRREVDVDAHIILGSTFDEKMVGKIRVSVVAAGLQQVAAVRPTPQPVRELQAGLNSAIMNAPSPAAELGITPQVAPVVAPVETVAPQPAPVVVPVPPAQQAAVNVPPSDLRPPAPIIRPRPAPMPDPAPVETQAAPEVAPAAQPGPHPSEPKERSFASLFGWKSKPADEPAPAPAAKPVAEDESFDDELEIPAFLRRSGNA